MAVLAAFSPNDDAVSSAELSRRADLPRSTTHRLVLELVQQGLLERIDDGYRPTMRVFEFGQLAPRARSLREAALPLMSDLHHAVQQTVNLAVLQDGDVVYVQILPHKDAPSLPSRVGGRLPAHVTALGKVMLAHSSGTGLDAAADTGEASLGSRKLREELRVIARHGVAYDNEKSAPGIWCLACPIFDSEGEAKAALSVSGAAHGFRPDLLARALATAASYVSGVLQQHGT